MQHNFRRTPSVARCKKVIAHELVVLYDPTRAHKVGSSGGTLGTHGCSQPLPLPSGSHASVRGSVARSATAWMRARVCVQLR